MDYIKGSLKNYLDDLWAKSAAPGGGSVAALAGALGASLLGMVINFTIEKKGYESHNNDLREILKAAAHLKARFEELVDEDVKAYLKLRDALKLKEKAGSSEALYKECASVPVQVCKLAYDGMKACVAVGDWGNRALISDVGIAAELFRAAFYSGKLNVDINLNYIQDKNFIKLAKSELADIEKHIESLKIAVTVKVKDVMYGKY